MSSAILYVAIVVIWAAVLIPRWLRRDSAAPASGSVPAMEAEGAQATVDLADEEQASPMRSPSRRSAGPSASRSRREEPPRERQPRPGEDLVRGP